MFPSAGALARTCRRFASYWRYFLLTELVPVLRMIGRGAVLQRFCNSLDCNIASALVYPARGDLLDHYAEQIAADCSMPRAVSGVSSVECMIACIIATGRYAWHSSGTSQQQRLADAERHVEHRELGDSPASFLFYTDPRWDDDDDSIPPRFPFQLDPALPIDAPNNLLFCQLDRMAYEIMLSSMQPQERFYSRRNKWAIRVDADDYYYSQHFLNHINHVDQLAQRCRGSGAEFDSNAPFWLPHALFADALSMHTLNSAWHHAHDTVREAARALYLNWHVAQFYLALVTCIKTIIRPRYGTMRRAAQRAIADYGIKISPYGVASAADVLLHAARPPYISWNASDAWAFCARRQAAFLADTALVNTFCKLQIESDVAHPWTVRRSKDELPVRHQCGKLCASAGCMAGRGLLRMWQQLLRQKNEIFCDDGEPLLVIDARKYAYLPRLIVTVGRNDPLIRFVDYGEVRDIGTNSFDLKFANTDTLCTISPLYKFGSLPALQNAACQVQQPQGFAFRWDIERTKSVFLRNYTPRGLPSIRPKHACSLWFDPDGEYHALVQHAIMTTDGALAETSRLFATVQQRLLNVLQHIGECSDAEYAQLVRLPGSVSSQSLVVQDDAGPTGASAAHHSRKRRRLLASSSNSI